VWTGIVEVAKPEARSWIRWVLLLCFGITALCLPLTVVAALLFFKKRTSAPFALIAALVASVVIGGIGQAVFIFSGLDDTTTPEQYWKETIRDAVGALLWSAYLLNSQRVRATFVRRRPAAARSELRDGLPPPPAAVPSDP
jgi:hypothetical protein